MLHVCIFVEIEKYNLETLDNTNFLRELVIQDILNLIMNNKGKITFSVYQKNIFGISNFLGKIYDSKEKSDIVFVDLNARLRNDFIEMCKNLLSVYDVLYNEENFFFLLKNNVIETIMEDEDCKLDTTDFVKFIKSLSYKYSVEKINFS